MDKKILKPVTVEQVSFAESQEVIIPSGNAFIVPIINGKEDMEQGFFVSIFTADKYYSNADKYVIKKKN